MDSLEGNLITIGLINDTRSILGSTFYRCNSNNVNYKQSGQDLDSLTLRKDIPLFVINK